jgi:hypothetical protein
MIGTRYNEAKEHELILHTKRRWYVVRHNKDGLARVWCKVCTERIKAICRQPNANISCITGEVYIKPVELLPCLTVRWLHHDSVVLMYTFFVSPHVSGRSF